MDTGLISATATGDQVAEIVDKIDAAVAGYPYTHVIMGCLALVIVTQKPDITPEALEKASKSRDTKGCTSLAVVGKRDVN